MAATTGTATVDFGSTPVSEASIAVTGQGGILTTSKVEAWVQEESTAGNSTTAHKALAFIARCYCRALVAGTGFTVDVLLMEGALATGTFKVEWVWS